ncbi:MAG: ileS [Alphaproteobacteria bacterium]|nr:ileS [Alphaproteobacteria bacterium]
MTEDFKDTLFLPQTEFPMRGELPKREPQILAQWQEMDLYKTLTENAAEREKFILHDGPPFANGDLHTGHALNKILKDVVLRTRFALGFNAPYVPGWDCHGLPIEWKVEEKYRAPGSNVRKDDIPPVEFRRECREFASKWVDVHLTDFQRLGVIGDWKNPYLSMNYESEALIAAEIHKFLMNGMLYRGIRPILWSVVEKTALAAAEVEYHEHTSTTIYVAFPITNATHLELNDTSVVIWTTTPWTMPGNRAIALGAEIEYGLYEVTETAEGSMLPVGRKFLLGNALAESVLAHAKVTGFNKLKDYKGSELAGIICAHPLAALHEYYRFDVPLLTGDFVTTDTGTGFVHIAPGHGEDDYRLGRANNITVPETVDGDGTYFPQVGLFAGLDVYDSTGKEGKATGAIIGKLVEAGALVAKGKLRHQYPHSWRSKAPLIFRTTAQWFIPMDGKGDLRSTAMQAIDDTQWIPAEGKNRISAMVKDRPDWCISRQRLWGVPIAIFVNKATREPLRDHHVNNRIVETFKAESADAWYARDAQYFLGDDYRAEDYEQIMDIVDVWFESGSTHAFVLEQREDQQWPADLYLEGSDQHRGWFQSSLLESCGTRGRAPYQAVMTHGFVVDKDGKKMSKSANNGLAPADIIQQFGADILRLWVLNSDYHEDVRISQDAFKAQSDIYRRYRNTLRYVLGNLEGFTAAERVDLKAEYAQIPELEKWVLHRAYAINEKIQKLVREYKFQEALKTVFDFCNEDLSAFYFDIRKDRLYCDRPDMFERRVTRSVLEALLGALTSWLAPFIPFTAEEAWAARPVSDFLGEMKTVHLRQYPEFPDVWQNLQVESDWETLRNIRRVVTGAIEIERAEKRLGSSLEAHPFLYLNNPIEQKLCETVDWAELAITSQFTLLHGEADGVAFTLDDVPDAAVVVQKATGEKCQRSWKILTEVGQDPEFPALSLRDADAVRYYRKQERAA